ncbi:MAG: hypothetical protein J5I81_03820 [Nitrococcus mobilis]|nr:hypothetical protein [Nitrococcus mobilis]
MLVAHGTAVHRLLARAEKPIRPAVQRLLRYTGPPRNLRRRLKSLEAENARLKKLLAESMLDNEALKAALSGKY